MKWILFFLGTMLLMSMACRKDVPRGTVIRANGFVFDSVKNKRLPGVTVYLVGASQNFYGIYYTNGPYDSAVSDSNGNFSMKYTAQDNSIDYGLEVAMGIYGGYTNQADFVLDANHPLYKFNYVYTANTVKVYARQLNYARVSLQVPFNPYNLFYVYVFSSDGSLFREQAFTGSVIDTAFLTRTLPEATNYFQFAAFNADSGFNRMLTDTINPAGTDTISLNESIPSIYSLPVQPD
jgi:hypothetical protein